MFLGGGVSHVPAPKGRRLSVPRLGDPTYAHMVWPRATIFGIVTLGGKGLFLRGQTLPKLGVRWAGPQRPTNFYDL